MSYGVITNIINHYMITNKLNKLNTSYGVITNSNINL